MQRDHLRVLLAYMERLNRKTGTAYPSRQAIAQEEGMSPDVVENALYELRRWGYIDWERRTEPQLHKGRLLHYTLPVTRYTEKIAAAVVALRQTLRGGNSPHRRGTTPPPGWK